MRHLKQVVIDTAINFQLSRQAPQALPRRVRRRRLHRLHRAGGLPGNRRRRPGARQGPLEGAARRARMDVRADRERRGQPREDRGPNTERPPALRQVLPAPLDVNAAPCGTPATRRPPRAVKPPATTGSPPWNRGSRRTSDDARSHPTPHRPTQGRMLPHGFCPENTGILATKAAQQGSERSR